MGYEQTTLSQINQLRDVLQRYHGFAVIRELIQNADDAAATRLEIGCVGPLVEADHPLLKEGPALFVVNDGPFSPANARSIKQLGLSDKAGDDATIGKFGLGLKSIHHFGEMYFYLSSANFEGSPLFDRYKPDGIQNPWHDEHAAEEDCFYPEWNAFTPEDRQRIHERLRPLLPGDQWFCLYVPLRRREQVGEELNAIAPLFPGDDRTPASTIFKADFEAEVARLLPFLRHLRSVGRWSDEGDGILREVSSLGFDGNHQQLRTVPPAYGYPWPLHGVIRIDHRQAETSTRLTFAGKESYQNHPDFNTIAKRKDWPRPLTLGKPGQTRGQSIGQAEPAIPHVAACFAWTPTPGESGQFKIAWASYLPVDSPSEPKMRLSNPDLVTLTLHGRFFVDAGRVGIDFGRPGSTEVPSVRQDWNDLLRDDGTLDLIIPALEKFAATVGSAASPGLIRELTETLQGSSLFQAFRGKICQRHQWVHLVGGDGAAWTRLELEGDLYAIPEPTASEPPLTEVFPRLRDLADNRLRLTYANWPSLRRSDELRPWPEKALDRLLKTDQTASFTDPARMSLVVRTLKVAMGIRPVVVERLIEIAQAGLAALGWGEVVRRQGMIEPFLDLIPADRKLAVNLGGTPDEVAGSLLAALWRNRWTTLIVPFGRGTARPVAQEREAMVGRLLGVDSEGTAAPFLEARADLVCQIVQSGGGDLDSAWAGMEDRAIFPVSGSGDGSLTLVARSTLKTALKTGRLFVERDGLAAAFRDALALGADRAVFTIARRLASTAFGTGVVPEASPAVCLAGLKDRPLLAAEVGRRIGLIHRLLATPGILNDEANRLSIRYLLHAEPAHFDDGSTLLVEAEAEGGEATVWRDLAARALRQGDADWRLVPALLAARFNNEQRSQLGLHVINRSGVVNLLQNHGPGLLDLADLADDDVRVILDDCKPDDFAVIRALPIHRTKAGARVAIDDECHWEGDFPVEADLAASVTVLEPHPDKAIAQKQRQIHPNVLDARGVLRLILGDSAPHQRWRTILEALTAIGTVPGNLTLELRGSPWVPLDAGRRVKPDQVVRVGYKDQAIQAILATVDWQPDEVVSILELPEPFRKHAVFVRLLPNEGDALEKLGQCLKRDARYRVGKLTPDQARPDAMRLLFGDAPSSIMPCFPLLASESSRGSTHAALDQNLTDKLIPRLLDAIPAERSVAILNYLADRHRSAPSHAKDRYFDGFCHYLEAATRTNQSVADLPSVMLLSAAGMWTTADRLTMGATHIVPASMLHPDLAKILNDHADRSDRQRQQSSGSGTIETVEAVRRATSYREEEPRNIAELANYLEEWTTAPRAVPRELVGGLLALLGDAEPMMAAARRFLGNHELTDLRDKLKWDASPPFDVKGVEQGGSGRDIHQTMNPLRVVGKLSEGDTVELTNLLGGPIQVRQAGEYDHLALSTDDSGPWVNPRYLTVRLRTVNPRSIPANLDPVAVLRLTARQILKAIDKRQKVANFDQVWDTLARSEQLDLEVAQKQMLDGLVHILENLSLQHTPPLADPIRRWREANRALVQGQADDAKRRDVEKRKQAARDALGDLIATDAEAQSHCLGAVQAKLRTFEYTPDSIPFELFQNADDAVSEWLELERIDHPADSGRLRFEVEVVGQSIRFSSWGRAINQHQRGDFDGRKWGYDQDLEKMLTLNRSDKGQNLGRDQRTTGKFGLGFKSVLLATDRPRVVSGRLAFEVVGGLYPVRLSADLQQTLADKLKEQNPEESNGTIIELPLNCVDAGAVLDRFRKLAPLLSVFGCQIRHCKVMAADGRMIPSEWKPARLGENPGLEVGELPGIGKGRLLVLRGETTALALFVTSAGITKLPDDEIPTIWVTAPTQQRAKLGFAINAPFTLDVGRSQIAHTSPDNEAVADQAGRELGALLLDLYHQAANDWSKFQQDLGLRPDLTPIEFWESIWNRLVRPLANLSDPLGLTLRRIFWGSPNHGMWRLIGETAALPTGLPEPGRGLTKFDRVRGAAIALLTRKGIYPEVSDWPEFQARFPAGTLISEAIKKDLHDLGVPMPLGFELISIGPLIDQELGADRQVLTRFADRFGRLVQLPSWDAWRLEVAASRNPDNLLERLERLQFQALDGNWRPAADLVVDAGGDEGLQARFAPARVILNPTYSDAGIAFFQACRSTARPSLSTLVTWAIEASGLARRFVLDYLDRGALAHELAEKLTHRQENHWLRRLGEADLIQQNFGPHQARVILGRLKINPIPTPTPTPPRPKPLDPGRVLQEISEWWAVNKSDAVPDCQRQWYPNATFPHLATTLNRQSSSADERKGWMILLMLGAMHTMGRTRADAHRGFLDRCERKGWLDTFAGPTTNLARWMDVLIEYHNDNVADSPYLQWMGRFANIFQLAHWLPDYVESYRAIGQFKKPFELEEILNLRTSSSMRGSGRDAPPVTRTLGIGACFVIRELVRTGQINNDQAHRHCFVPTARVRRLFTLLGCPGLEDGYRSASERVMGSAVIHRFITERIGKTEATFQGDFDLPFLALTESRNRHVLERLLNTGINGDLDLIEETDEEVF